MSNDPRKEISRLIYDGLMGRTVMQLFHELEKRFAERSEMISDSTFYRWLAGESFPASLHRKKILAEVLGGPCGEAILKLGAPPHTIRQPYKPRRTEPEETTMKPHSGRNTRMFELVTRNDEGGKPTKQARISCARCGAQYHHLRRGEMDSEVWFTKKGWSVGHNAAHDECPRCVEAKTRKVVKMSDHKKPDAEPEVAVATTAETTGQPQPQPMGKEVGRILSRSIEEVWDEQAARYKNGWSDLKMAEKEGVPIDWVREIRERDFGGAGDDPGIEQFLAEMVSIGNEVGDLRKHLDELESGVANAAEHHRKLAVLVVAYRDKHNVLAKRAAALAELGERVSPAPAAAKKVG
jgi:hypothetical protein